MDNMDVNELVLWVQKTVGHTINEMSSQPHGSCEEWGKQSIRENMYVEATRFLISDTPGSMELKKECVVQTLERIKSAFKIRGKQAEVEALSNKSLYWNQSDAKQFTLKISSPHEFKQMLEGELERIGVALKCAEDLFAAPTHFKNKVQNARSEQPRASTPSKKA